MSLISQIEDVCSAIKHTPEAVDIYHVQGLLRSCQVALETAELLTNPELLSLNRDTAMTALRLSVDVDNELVPELVAWLHRVTIEDIEG